MVVTGNLRGWRGHTPAIVGLGAKLTSAGVEVDYLWVGKRSRAQTVTLNVHISTTESRRVRVKWERFPVTPDGYGDAWKDVSLEYDQTQNRR